MLYQKISLRNGFIKMLKNWFVSISLWNTFTDHMTIQQSLLVSLSNNYLTV